MIFNYARILHLWPMPYFSSSDWFVFFSCNHIFCILYLRWLMQVNKCWKTTIYLRNIREREVHIKKLWWYQLPIYFIERSIHNILMDTISRVFELNLFILLIRRCYYIILVIGQRLAKTMCLWSLEILGNR